MILFWLLVSTIIGSLIAMSIASWLAYKIFSKYLHHMVSLSVGILLSVGLLHLLPEAYHHNNNDSNILFNLILISLICFFALEKISLLRHNHHYEGDGHQHHKGYDSNEAGRGGILILIGSSLHNFSDGLLVSAAFLTDPSLGIVTSASITIHEIPHKLSNFVVLKNAGLKLYHAFTLILFSSLFSLIGGITGYFLLQENREWIPYFLVIASSSFLYISMADLMPQMHEKRSSILEVIPQLLFVIIGVTIIYIIKNLIHHNH